VLPRSAFLPDDAPALELDRPVSGRTAAEADPQARGDATPAPRRSKTARLIIILLLACGAIAAWQGLGGRQVPREVRVTLDGLPHGTHVVLDGRVTSENPLVLPGSRAAHELRLECLGYRPRVLTFVPTEDQRLDGSLVRR
jgi:hypothetical protein